ncbi:MAG: type II toxin-antitoxin system PemK/MazF family toxin [Alphaproteobacteria bacterium]|nr:type II toxin-antitoxin system PemK/MazF family toxin [Alphaproteobacteria bacterium]
MPLRPFDIVIVPFPYADRLAEKRRPAVVISKPPVGDRYKLVWLAMITSAANPKWECDIEISDLKSTALPAPSRIRPVKIATADEARVVRRIGKLGAKDAKALAIRLASFMAI